jgi:DNA (cytosine-5)-methyltransferase 1
MASGQSPETRFNVKCRIVHSDMLTQPTVLSTFTGPGGLDLGLERAGFRTLACIEQDPLPRATLRRNRPHWKILEPGGIGEVAAELRPRHLGLREKELCLLAGGPPCQPFSKAGQWSPNGRSGFGDRRADGLAGFMRLVETFLPRAVLIENVPGFAKGQSSAFRRIQQQLQGINERAGTAYRLEVRFLNAVNFGVAQKRERAILVAFRDGHSFNWPHATHCDCPVRAWDAIGHLRNGRAPDSAGKWTALLPSIPEGQNYLWHTPRGGGEPLFGYRTKYWSFLLKLAKDQPSWTLPAHPGPGTGPFHWADRPLTIREMLRLQSFPATWKVEGRRREQVLQVGNATPPLLAEVLARAIASHCWGKRFATAPTLAIPRKRHVPPPEPVRSVPKHYLSLRGDHPDHPGAGRGPGTRRRRRGGPRG